MTECIPDYGDLMTISEWEECVGDGVFIDDDGFGHFADVGLDTMDGDMEVYPSMLGTEEYEEVKHDWTHIIWFNR